MTSSTTPGTPPRIVGHHASWGLTASPARIQPYTLTPGSVDTMCVRVREKIDVRGVGTDVVLMEGTFTVRRDHPCSTTGSEQPKWGESCIKTEFRSLELYGESQVFGTVRVHLDPAQSSHGEVGPGENGSLAASCVAHCYPVIEMPELGMKLTTAGQPVNLASKVVQIPPVGDVARSENSALLVDEHGNEVGEIVSSDIEVGEVLCTFPLGRTGRPSEGHEDHHGPHHHPAPSGPGFYAEGPSKMTEKPPEHGGGHAQGHTHPVAETAAVEQKAILTSIERMESGLRDLIEAVRQMVKH